MFDNFEKFSQSSKKMKKFEDKGINLLPNNLKQPEKPRKRRKWRLEKVALHPASKIAATGKDRPKSFEPKLKSKSFLLAKIISLFKSKGTKVKAPETDIRQAERKKPVSEHKSFWRRIKRVFTGNKRIIREKQAQVSPPAAASQVPSPGLPSHFSVNQPDKAAKDIQVSQSLKPDLGHAPTAKLANAHKELKKNESVEDELEVNLLPKKKFRLSNKQILLSYIMIFIIGLLATVSPFVLYTSSYRKYNAENQLLLQQLETNKQQQKEIQSQTKELKPLSTRFVQLLSLLNKHTYWSNFFPSLERHTHRDVYFTSLGVDEAGKVNLSGKALSLRTAAEQLVVFRTSRDYFDIELTSLSILKEKPGQELNDLPIDFSVSFSLQPSIIYPDDPQSLLAGQSIQSD